VGYEIYKSLKDTTRKEYYPKFSIGISYSPGIAYTGMLSRSLETGEMDPFHMLYWNNVVDIETRYYINPHWAIGIGGGYMWTHLEERGSFLDIPVKSWEEPWGSTGLESWDIWSYYGSFISEYIISHKPTTLLIEGGMEYYLSKSYCIEGKGRHNHKTGGSEFRIVKGVNYSKGCGFLISVGLKKPMFSNFHWHVLLVFRYGTSQSYKQLSEEEDVIWDQPVNLNFTGLYIKAGVSYDLILKKGG